MANVRLQGHAHASCHKTLSDAQANCTIFLLANNISNAESLQVNWILSDGNTNICSRTVLLASH